MREPRTQRTPERPRLHAFSLSARRASSRKVLPMSDDRLDVPRTSGAGLRLAAIGWMLYWAGRAPHAGQWDSFDYLKQIVTHRLSDLGFGRPVFLGYNIVLWEATKKA